MSYLILLTTAAVLLIVLWLGLCRYLTRNPNHYRTAEEQEEREETYIVDRLLELRSILLGLPVTERMRLLQDFQTQANGCISKKPNGSGMNTSTGKSCSYPNLSIGLKPGNG